MPLFRRMASSCPAGCEKGPAAKLRFISRKMDLSQVEGIDPKLFEVELAAQGCRGKGGRVHAKGRIPRSPAPASGRCRIALTRIEGKVSCMDSLASNQETSGPLLAARTVAALPSSILRDLPSTVFGFEAHKHLRSQPRPWAIPRRFICEKGRLGHMV